MFVKQEFTYKTQCLVSFLCNIMNSDMLGLENNPSEFVYKNQQDRNKNQKCWVKVWFGAEVAISKLDLMGYFRT